MRSRWVVLFTVVALLSSCASSRHGASRPRPGGILRVGVSTITSFDPAQARALDDLLVADQLFDGLTAADPTTHQPVAALADHWQASADQRQWDFFLRRGVTFSNGRAITSTDVKYSLERAAKPGSGSPSGELLAPVTGYTAFATQGTATELTGITTPSPNLVHLALDQPQSVLPSLLSSPVFGVVARESVEAVAPAPLFAEQPVTSGPFTVTSKRRDSVVLTRSPGSRALLAGMQLVEVDDVAAAYRSLRAGKLDWAEVPPEEVDGASRQFGRSAFAPYQAELFYGFNLKSPKFADVRFREAIVRAIDRTAIVKAVYGGTVRPTSGVVVAGIAEAQPDACGERCRHDPEAAKRLLAEAFGDAPVPGIELAFDDDQAQRAVARAMKSGLDAVGIPTTLAPKPLKEYKEFAVSGKQELFRLGWIARYPSADDFLPPLFATGSPNNLTAFASADVDKALREARAEGDAGRRVELYRRAEATIMSQVPVIPIAQFEIHAAVSSRVRGLAMDSTGTFNGSVVWLSDAR